MFPRCILKVLPVCSSWEDHAWVQYNALVEGMIESRLAQFDRGGRSKTLALPITKIASTKDIFDRLANSDNQAVKYVKHTLARHAWMFLRDWISFGYMALTGMFRH
jgi:hypothetical protein